MSEPRIETERLVLRLPIREDFDAYAANMADIGASRFIGGPQSRAAAWRGFLQFAGAWSIQGFSMFSVVEKAGGRWIGRVGPWYPEGWPGREVGWAIVRDAWGKGYATEAAAAAMRYAFDVLGWDAVVHSIAPDNPASQGVARKLGSRLIGPGQLPEPFQDEVVKLWGQSREDWKATYST